MKICLISLLASIFLSIASFQQVFADSRDGLWLLHICKSGLKSGEGQSIKDFTDSAQCFGYMQGTTDTYISNDATHKFGYCIPANVRLEQALRVVIQYLKNHPANLNLPASFLIIAAQHDAWPCKKLDKIK